eukprot:gnl/MRDRNA2_/MRDRNA2_88485_c0_seq1.p1 gnl/MRDRNA2_/MRDRNA2_88485_c0~~gnl/MRDRNA2_/MRDRNA2_88485_c0_seq1.p1  ORF type:complete len:185 (+),score=30.81 gnl/MRDRNA2_/MRDRNA2_88485_c0_seq1:87-641(+)
MMASSVVIHRVGVARKRNQSARKFLAHKEPTNADIRAMKTLNRTDEQILPDRAICAVEELRYLPIIEGMLMKRGQSWMGLGESKWRERYVVLDPGSGNLAYWDTKAGTASAPKREYALEDLICFEANEYHNTIMLNFCRQNQRKQVGKSLNFMANSQEDFDRWVEILSRYGMKDPCTPVAAVAA